MVSMPKDMNNTFVSIEALPEPANETWYFTFGGNHITAKGHQYHSLGQCYIAIEGTWAEARNTIVELRGNKWSFQYSYDEFKDQPARFNLKQVYTCDIYLPEEER